MAVLLLNGGDGRVERGVGEGRGKERGVDRKGVWRRKGREGRRGGKGSGEG